MLRVGLDHDTELKSTAAIDKDKTYVLPDVNIITVGAERFHCAEAWYQSSFTGKEACGFHDTSFQNIMCVAYIRKELYANVVLSDRHIRRRVWWNARQGPLLSEPFQRKPVPHLLPTFRCMNVWCKGKKNFAAEKSLALRFICLHTFVPLRAVFFEPWKVSRPTVFTLTFDVDTSFLS